MPYSKLGRFTRRLLQIGARLKDEPTVVDVPANLAAAKSIMVCAPRDPHAVAATSEFVRALRQVLPAASLLLVWQPANAGDLDASAADDVLTIAAKDIGWHGLPKRWVVEQVDTSSFDLALDLSIDFDLVNAHLCRKSRAPLRACLFHPHRDPFFNLQVRTSSSMSIDNRYRALLRCLESLLPRARSRPVPDALPT